MLCFPLRLFNVPALAVGLVLYYTLSLDSINLIPNPNPVKVALGLLGLYLCWGKPRLVTLRSRLCLVVVTKDLAIPLLFVVTSPLAMLSSSTSLFCPLAPYCYPSWHLTASSCSPDGRAPTRLHPVVTLHYLHAWCPTPGMDVIRGATICL